MRFKKTSNNLIEELPGDNGNAYSSSKQLYHAIKVDKDKIIASNNDITEAIDWEVSEDKQGGVIIFSTDVNAISLNDNKVINWIKQKVITLKNRILSTKKIDKISQNNNLIGWTVGHFLDGRYTSKNGVSFGENSLSVELIGVDSNTLIKVATELCREFMQESVLVKDYTTGKILFVNGD